MASSTRLWGMPPRHAIRIVPLLSNSIPAGWPEIPSWRQDSNVGSQSMVKVVPVDCTKPSANPRLSWVPTPMTVILSELFRANCSTLGASRRQMVQWGAQNHSTRGWSAGAKLARFTVAPVATFTTSTEGRSEAGAGASLTGACSAAGAWVGGVVAGVEVVGAPLSPQAAAPTARQAEIARTLILVFIGARTSGSSNSGNRVQDPAVRRAGPLIDFLAKPVKDDYPVLAGDSKAVPGGTGRIPQHGEGCPGSVHEILSLSEIVAGTHSDEGELVGVVSSQLVEAGGFPAAGGSMRSPEPQHDGPIRRGVAGQVHAGSGGHVHHLHRWQV